jgi:predicted Rossmann fold nucleotide-binding protein DprA/Smf involved in DNA uptake
MREMADWIELGPEDPRYPPRLREGKKKKKEKDWPPTLFCRGNLELLASDRLVAIVGSRRVGKKAVEATKELARRLAERGGVIVSGFARGIDQAAFEGALADPRGQTIAVLAQGLDEQLRDEDERLMEEKLATCRERLLVVSRFPPGEPWSGRNAMTRNEIIVGLAQVVIVGAIGPERTPRKDGRPRRSGTWDAVQKAVRWGREVWIPGYLRGNEHAERLCACYPAVRVIDDPVGELEQRWLEAAEDEGRGETRPQQVKLFRHGVLLDTSSANRDHVSSSARQGSRKRSGGGRK